MANKSEKFELWCEFEELDPREYDPGNDHSDVFVTFADGRKYLLKVWTFDYVQTVADGHAPVDSLSSAGSEPVDHLVPPDLLVRVLDREIIEGAIKSGIESGELDFSDDPALLADPDDDSINDDLDDDDDDDDEDEDDE